MIKFLFSLLMACVFVFVLFVVFIFTLSLKILFIGLLLIVLTLFFLMRIGMKLILGVAIGAAFVWGALHSGSHHAKHAEAPRLELVTGSELFSVLESPDTVIAYEVSPASGEELTQDYALSDPNELSQQEIAALQKVLLEDKSYYFDVCKSCIFLPEVALQFHRGSKVALLLIDTDHAQVKFVHETCKRLLDCDPARHELTELFYISLK